MVKKTVDKQNLVDFCRWLKENLEEKKALARYIAEKRGIKVSSALRNLNRMINYYLQTGKQARSGRKYLKDIKEWLQKEFELKIEAGEFVGVFPNLDQAKEYVADIPVLRIGFTGDFEPFVWRTDESP